MIIVNSKAFNQAKEKNPKDKGRKSGPHQQRKEVTPCRN